MIFQVKWFSNIFQIKKIAISIKIYIKEKGIVWKKSDQKISSLWKIFIQILLLKVLKI